jgi:two-component system, OmpR family, heavy metal sensor histidine kinase CusS
MKLSITARLVVMFAAVTLLTFAGIGVALYVVLEHELVQHQDQELATNLQNLQYSIERVDTLDRWARVQAKMDTLTPSDGRIRFWVLSDDPRFQYGKGLAAMQNMIRNDDGTGTIELPSVKAPIRTMSRDIEPLKDRPVVRLIVGSDSAPYRHTLHDFLIALVALSLTSILAVMAIGYWIARVGLRPLKHLSVEARALRPKVHPQRLQAAHLPVELADFAVAFNGAIGRLEDAYRQLEAFNADVAHELRTPLANLIGGTQVALSRPRGVAELEEILQSNLEELEQLRLIINDMLFLARADQGEVATGLVRTTLATEVRKTIDFYEVLLDDLGAGVEIVGDVDAEAAIETALFRRALSNLLQNAIEHSAAGAKISVEIRRGAHDVWVGVTNPGEPIADSHVRRLFDRFYRVDAARNLPGRPHGHGLGLAIVKAVATMHSGSVSASSAGGLTTIGFSVPLAGGAAAAVPVRPESEAQV